MKNSDFLFNAETYSLRKAFFEVHNTIGCGFLEAVYQECLERELLSLGIPFKAQEALVISYKGEPLKQRYVPDFICFDKIIVEIKAVKKMTDVHKAQVINYLKATNMQLGLLVNFGTYPKVEIVRLVNFIDS